MSFNQIKQAASVIHKAVKEIAPWAGVGGVTWAVVKDNDQKKQLKLSDGQKAHHLPLTNDEADHIENGGKCQVQYGCGSTIKINH